jgi:hypothetical protein
MRHFSLLLRCSSICALLGFYADLFAKVILTLEVVTDRLSQNVGNNYHSTLVIS